MSQLYELEEWCRLMITLYCLYAYNIFYLMKSLFHRGLGGTCAYIVVLVATLILVSSATVILLKHTAGDQRQIFRSQVTALACQIVTEFDAIR